MALASRTDGVSYSAVAGERVMGELAVEKSAHGSEKKTMVRRVKDHGRLECPCSVREVFPLFFRMDAPSMWPMVA